MKRLSLFVPVAFACFLLTESIPAEESNKYQSISGGVASAEVCEQVVKQEKDGARTSLPSHSSGYSDSREGEATDEPRLSQTSAGIITNASLGLKSSDSTGATSITLSSPRFSIWRSIGAMLVVIGGLLAANSYISRRRDGIFAKKNRDKRIIVIERTAIDHRRSLLLIEVDGQRIVLGVAPDRMETVAILSGKAPERMPVEPEEERMNLSFSDSLKSMISRNKENGRK